MRAHRAVRAAAVAESSIASVRSCTSRPRFLCLNASSRSLGAGPAVGKGNGQRLFSESRIARAGAAEAV